MLPYGPILGRAAQESPVGRWVLGRGAAWLVVAGAVAIAVRLRRRAAPAAALVVACVIFAGYAASLFWLRAIRLERVHLPEYGIAALLSWRAMVPALGDRRTTYVAAAALAALVGWGDELVQAVTPGRVYDLRDVAANALGAALGAALLAVWRAGTSPHEAPEPPTASTADR